jgi:NADPH-dependent ferric siderophore reductase
MSFPALTGAATLVERVSLTPRMLRVTLHCDAFGHSWPIQQPGEIITLLFVPLGESIALPERGWVFPGGAKQEWRNYTVRRHRPDAGEIDVDVVLHEPKGPACTWAARMPLGAQVGSAGPRADFAPKPDAEWLLLAGDETALPAIAAILETPRVIPTLAVVEVHDAKEELALPGVKWVHRDGAPAATTTHLADALRELELPDGAGQAWGAAESRIARDLRAVLRDERGMPRSHATARGYWLRSGEWDLDD